MSHTPFWKKRIQLGEDGRAADPIQGGILLKAHRPRHLGRRQSARSQSLRELQVCGNAHLPPASTWWVYLEGFSWFSLFSALFSFTQSLPFDVIFISLLMRLWFGFIIYTPHIFLYSLCHDYLSIYDVLILADVFPRFRSVSMELGRFEVDPAHCLRTPDGVECKVHEDGCDTRTHHGPYTVSNDRESDECWRLHDQQAVFKGEHRAGGWLKSRTPEDIHQRLGCEQSLRVGDVANNSLVEIILGWSRGAGEKMATTLRRRKLWGISSSVIWWVVYLQLFRAQNGLWPFLIWKWGDVLFNKVWARAADYLIIHV